MLLSLKDEWKLYFEGVEDSFTLEIALAPDEDAENVKLKLSFLQRHGLIEICDDDEYQLTEVPAIIGSETASTIRSRECRERKKQLALEQKVLQCNTNETGGNTLQQNYSVEKFCVYTQQRSCASPGWLFSAGTEGRDDYISKLCAYPLLILDDFGMKRGTEYGLEQV